MDQSKTLLDQLLLEVQFLFVNATPNDKERFFSKLLPWAEQLVEELGIENKTSIDESTPDEQKEDRSTKPRAIQIQEIRALIEKEVYLKQISENIEYVLWLQDIHSDRIFYVNPAYEKVWGQSCANLYADPLSLINSVHPEDRLQVMVARPPHDQKTYNQAYRILRPDGSLRWIFSRTFLLRDKAGAAVCLFSIAQDITDQKQVELALRKTLDRTREQFDLSRKMSLTRKPEAALRILMSANELRPAHRAALLYFYHPKIGPAHGVELISSWQSSHDLPAWPSETGLYEDPALMELFDQKRTTVFQIRSDPRLKDTLRTCLLEGKVQTLIIFPLIASGIWLGSLMAYYDQERLLDHNGLRHLKVLVDQAAVTYFNLQLLEFEEDSRHEAERANEIKTEFLAMISHELRTPLISIIGFTTTLLAEDVAWEPGEQHDFFLTIQQEADRLQELIEHLLDLSRLEAGMLPISVDSHSLQDIIIDASSQFQTLTIGHTLALNIPDNLPPVFGDARRIAQVLVNLVRNASTYAPQGTEICISAMVRGGSMQINVSDQGPGIPPGEIKKVFQAFRRGKNVEKRSPQGAGLGLAICKGSVETQGGRIWIKKKNAPGATICFTIPLAPLDNSVGAIKEEKLTMGNILIVEDDPNIRKLVRVNLVKRGYSVSEAGDSHQAINLFQKESVDLVLLDLMLPGLSGVDICKWIRERSDVPIIVLSARLEEDLKVAALDAGADDYVTKPFGQEELLARVRAFLRRSYSVAQTSESKMQIGDLCIDLEARRVFISENDLHLTRTEYAILAELANRLDAIVTHDELITTVWGMEYRGSNHYLHTYLGRLRKKLGDYGDLLETVPGMGYNLHSKKIY